MNVLARTLLALAAATGLAHAQGGIQPGEYLDGSGGVLTIKPASGGTLPFTLHTVGGNMHTCDASGAIKNGQAVLKPDGGGTCTLVFGAKPDGIEVTIKNECKGFCGARATLDGTFLKPPAGCDRASVKKTRAEFKQLYDRKSYANARSKLEPVLKNCSKTIDNWEDGWIRNDLALSQFRAGDAAACRKTLEPLAEDAGKTEAKIREDFPPADADATIRIAKATRTNLKLCAGK